MIEKFVTESDRRKEIAKIRLKENQEELGEEAAKKVELTHIITCNELTIINFLILLL